MAYYAYILANSTGTTIYIGVTNNLLRRVTEHRTEVNKESFTAKYHVHKLVYYESTGNIESALNREKQLKSWNRKRKNKLIEQMNPQWVDLYEELLR